MRIRFAMLFGDMRRGQRATARGAYTLRFGIRGQELVAGRATTLGSPAAKNARSALDPTIEHEWVNQRPEEERASLLEGVAPYDPLTAPVLPEVGYLAEAFRTHEGTIVDPNPSGRFAARGARAEELLRDLPWDDYYGPGSALHRLCDAGGRVLRLGANPETPTVLHYAEYLAPVPDKRCVRRHYRVVGANGPETRSVECLDDEYGIVDWDGDDDYFAVALTSYLTAGHGLRGRVGNADAELLDASDLVAFGARWMGAHLVPATP